jgi:hypothetical protein
MKKPDFKFKRPTGGPKIDLKPPRFLADLYADLRDRRLLPLVALLIVAIIAAPILLSESGNGENSPPTPPAAGGPTSNASFSVVPAEPGLRQYKKRLGYRTARNPFANPLTRTERAVGEAGENAEAAGAESEAPTSSEGSSPTPESQPTETTTNSVNDVVVEHSVVSYGVDLRAGFVPESKQFENVLPMTKLPNPKHQVVVFVGLSRNHKAGLFLMTSGVVAYNGAGKCVVDQQSCQLLELRPGQAETFRYGIEETRYRVIVQKIDKIVSTSQTGASVTTEESSEAKPKETPSKPAEEAPATETPAPAVPSE